MLLVLQNVSQRLYDFRTTFLIMAFGSFGGPAGHILSHVRRGRCHEIAAANFDGLWAWIALKGPVISL